MRPIHPGEILREEYLLPLNMSVNALAKAISVPDTALRFTRYFGGDAKSWLNLQTEYDLKVTEAASSIEREVTPREAA